MSKKNVNKFPTGKLAFLKDFYCHPGQVGGCKIVAPSSKGPDFAIVEWKKDNYHEDGDVDVVRLTFLDIVLEPCKSKRVSREKV